MRRMEARVRKVNQILSEIIDIWYERIKANYVTEKDSELLGLTPELKCFHQPKNHRIKFSRKGELDVTYGLRIREKNGRLVVEASVNNKSEGFDYEAFVQRLESYYWKSRLEKPWTRPDFDRFAYGDLLQFEPRMGHSVSLDVRQDRADIIRLSFALKTEYEDLLMQREDLLQDLVENYCLAPLRRIYAESYRQP